MLLRRHIILILLTLEEGSPALIIMTDKSKEQLTVKYAYLCPDMCLSLSPKGRLRFV